MPRVRHPEGPTQHVQARPAGSTAAIASLVVLIASWCGLDVTAEQAAVLIGGVTAIVSVFTPR